MRHEISMAAGQILNFLETHGETSALALRSSLKFSQTLLFLALGWLSQQDKIDLVFRDRSCWVLLKK